MKLRWPLWKSRCNDCGHLSLVWQKPWYKPRVPGPNDELLGSLWGKVIWDPPPVTMPKIEFSKNAVIHIPHIMSSPTPVDADFKMFDILTPPERADVT